MKVFRTNLIIPGCVALAILAIKKVGHPGPDTRFIIIEHDEDESGQDSLHLRLTIPFISPSDYFSLDEFRKIGFRLKGTEH